MDLFRIRRKSHIVLLGGILICNLAATATIGTYIHDFDANMFGVLLATLAAVTRRNYIGIRPEEIEGDQIMTMDDVLTKWEQGVFDKGEKSGFDKGQVQACQDFGKTEDETIQYLMQKYGMTLELARSTTQKYWQHSS